MSMQENDRTQALQCAIEDAMATGTPLNITGGGSKAFYGREAARRVLNMSHHSGIVNYHPSELVVTARSGTPLLELKKILFEQGQMLAFEPPLFGEAATLGGTVACGFSGSRRPFTGSARDFVLGCKLINGKAEVLSFGGEVIKNVAGYDISRLMVGAMGTLGVLLEVSLKVLPLPAAEVTRSFELPVAEAIVKMNELAGRSLPVSGLSYDGRLLYVRLSGSENAVKTSAAKLGGEIKGTDCNYWHQLNEQTLEFFQTDRNVWRLSLPSATEHMDIEGDWYFDWGGGLRWLVSDAPADRIFTAAEKAQGHAVLFKSKDRNGDIFQPLSGKLKELNRAVKRSFDPEGLFNPNRMYKDW